MTVIVCDTCYADDLCLIANICCLYEDSQVENF